VSGCARVIKVFSSEREVVVGVDGSEHSKDAVIWAVREAKLREAVLRPICVAPAGSDVDFDWTVGNSLTEWQKVVDGATEAAAALEPTVVVRGEVLVGPVADTLIGASEVSDLLVVGARGLGAISQLLLGSVSRSCARAARCPVVIVHELAQSVTPASSSRIVVEVEEGSDSATLDWAIEEAVLRSARVEAIFDCAASNVNDGTELLTRACDELASEFTRFTSSYIQPRANGVFPTSRAQCVSTVKALLEACQGADLLVLSDVGPEGEDERGAGSILRRCVQLVPCPVIVVHSSASRIARSQGRSGSRT
jgi:nucleotide-binding universal stress UspA family protein